MARGGKSKSKNLQTGEIQNLAEMFRLLGDPTRLRIVLACSTRDLSVGDIAETLELSQSLVSHHLRLLRAGRILRAERHGRHVFYGAADDHIRHVIADMVEHVAEAHSHTRAKTAA